MANNKNVFVVEDDKLLCDMIEKILENKGYSVRSFYTIEHAKSAIDDTLDSKNYADIVILDLFFRKNKDTISSFNNEEDDVQTFIKERGYNDIHEGRISEEVDEFFRYLVRLRPPLGIIVMSGRVGQSVMFPFLTRGAMAIMTKPWSYKSELMDKVGRCYDKVCAKRDYYLTEWSGIRRSPRTAFISYSSANSDNALGLVNWLESEGVSVYYAEMSMPAGANWGQELIEAIGKSPIFIAFLTREALQSKAVEQELHRAIQRKMREGDEYLLIPLLYKTNVYEIPKELQELHCVDISDEYYYIERVMELKRIIQQFNKKAFR